MPWKGIIPHRPHTAREDEESIQERILEESSRCKTNAKVPSDDSHLVDEDWELVPYPKQPALTTGDDSAISTESARRKSKKNSPIECESSHCIDSSLTENTTEETSLCHPSAVKEDVSTRQKQQKLPQRMSSKSKHRSFPSRSELLEAIRTKNESSATFLLLLGADPNSTDVWGPAINQALRAGLKKLPHLLLSKGASPDATDVWGPVLTHAIRAGDIDLASKLLQKGASPDAEDVWGPALTQAIRGRYERLAILLVRYGANKEARDTWGSALVQSIRCNLCELTKVLLDGDTASGVGDKGYVYPNYSKEQT